MRKLLFVILMFSGLTGFCQNSSRHIHGLVTNETNLPIPGATVIITGTAIGTQTDVKGRYTINVPAGHISLSFSFIGYQRKTVKLNAADTLNVQFKASGQQLAEIVIVGYATQRRTDVTGSVSSISSVKIADKNIAQVANNLQGKVAGVSVLRRGAAPKASAIVLGYASAPAVPVNPDESYKGIAENGFDITGDKPLSTFSVDVDGAAYTNVRRYINGGHLPPVDAVRIEEMINYFSYNLPGPANDEPVAIHTELSSAPWNAKHRLLRIGLKAKTIAADKLPPSNLVFLLDVSGSMSDENKLPLVKASMKLLVDQLRPQDKVTIVAYAGEAGLVLAPTSGDRKASIDSAIDQLNASGSTNGGEGIKLAYKLARQNFMPKGNNRIVMATDGDFNVGPSSDGDMETLVTKERESNVALSIMGVGMGNLKDSKMETIADKGNGNYFYIDNITEARKALVSEFGGTLFTVAKDVKLQVEFNPAKVQAYRLIGYEDRMLNKEDFNNDKKDAGDMGSGHTVTALYEIVPAGIKDDFAGTVDPLKYQKPAPVAANTGGDELLTVKFRYKQPISMESKMSLVVVKDTPEVLAHTSTDFRFAAAVAEFGLLLRDSPYKQKASFDEAISMARGAKGEDNDGNRAEFIKLAENAKLMAKSELVSVQ